MRLLYVQPLLPNYRNSILRSFQQEYDLIVASDKPSPSSGFSEISFNGIFVECFTRSFFNKRILYQSGAVWAFIRHRPNIVFLCANTRDLAYWAILFLAFICRVPVFSHGQGLYSKSNKIGFLLSFAYLLIGFLTFRYVSYSKISHDSLVRIGFPSNKLIIAENSIEVLSNAGNLLKTAVEPGVLFVGRLRRGAGIEKLINAVEDLRRDYPNVIVHIVGGGEFESIYRKNYNYDWVKFYGAVFDENEILEISKLCRVGCYPGNAGLSVVHFFALRLPPIVHDCMCLHMGPEPSYVVDGHNGFLFKYDNVEHDLLQSLRRVWRMQVNDFLSVSDNSYREYLRLNNPGLGPRIVGAISNSIGG